MYMCTCISICDEHVHTVTSVFVHMCVGAHGDEEQHSHGVQVWVKGFLLNGCDAQRPISMPYVDPETV